jgi:hypothetical protein
LPNDSIFADNDANGLQFEDFHPNFDSNVVKPFGDFLKVVFGAFFSLAYDTTQQIMFYCRYSVFGQCPSPYISNYCEPTTRSSRKQFSETI